MHRVECSIYIDYFGWFISRWELCKLGICLLIFCRIILRHLNRTAGIIFRCLNRTVGILSRAVLVCRFASLSNHFINPLLRRFLLPEIARCTHDMDGNAVERIRRDGSDACHKIGCPKCINPCELFNRSSFFSHRQVFRRFTVPFTESFQRYLFLGLLRRSCRAVDDYRIFCLHRWLSSKAFRLLENHVCISFTNYNLVRP